MNEILYEIAYCIVDITIRPVFIAAWKQYDRLDTWQRRRQYDRYVAIRQRYLGKTYR